MKQLDLPDQEVPLEPVRRDELRAACLKIILNELDRPVVLTSEQMEALHYREQKKLISESQDSPSVKMKKMRDLQRKRQSTRTMRTKTYSEDHRFSATLETNEDHSTWSGTGSDGQLS